MLILDHRALFSPDSLVQRWRRTAGKKRHASGMEEAGGGYEEEEEEEIWTGRGQEEQNTTNMFPDSRRVRSTKCGSKEKEAILGQHLG